MARKHLCQKQSRLHEQPKIPDSNSRSLNSLCRLGVCDLIDHNADTALGDDVQHWEKVDHRVSAPTDDSHNLRSPDLALDGWVFLSVGGRREAKQELVDNVQEESH